MTYTPVREEIRITPAKVERIRLMQEVAICPDCKKDGDGTVVKAEVYPALLPHSPASASSIAYIIFDKCFMGMPYYRQESGMAELGFKLPRETMANWFIYCTEHYFYPIYERMHEHLIKREILHADETTCQVLREEGKKAESTSYMWIYLTGSDGLPPIILYDYAAGRAGNYARDFLEGFKGLLQCDGYQGYHKVADVILVCCLAHCRRKFYEAIPAGRRKQTPKSGDYALNHRETLCNYMKDGRCEISNNAAERRAKAMRLVARHFYFTHQLPGQTQAQSCTAWLRQQKQTI